MKKVESKIRRLSDVKKVSKSEDKVIFEDFFSQKVLFNYDNDLKNLIKYIELQGEMLSIVGNHTGKNLTTSDIFLNPAEKYYESFLQINSLRFLVYLSREKVITDLYLPLYIQEKTKIDNSKTYIVEWYPSMIYWGLDELKGAIGRHLTSNEPMRIHIVHFIVNDWLKFLKIIKELETKAKEEQKITEGKKEPLKQDLKKELDFDLDKAILYINEYKVKIQKFSDQYHLLRIIFEDKKELFREWFFSEIAEKYDEANEKLSDKKFYNAVYQLNQKIAIDTGFKDFFTTTTQTFQIDSQYTKNS